MAVTTYRVYHAPDGSAPSYCGERDTLDEAREFADTEPASLEQSLWDTAAKAAHCGGLSAPGSGEEGEPISWHGKDGWFCVVPVTRPATAEEEYTAG